MKFSQFNSLVSTNGKFALFNALTQRTIFLDNVLFDLLLSKPSTEDLSVIHPSFYEHLVDNEFVLLDEVDEVAVVKEISRKVDWDNSEFTLTINPTMTCNFSCHYCYETHIAKSRISQDTSARVRKFISETINVSKVKSFALSFFGGEPLLYFEKDVLPIIDHYVDECRASRLSPSISFTTNGYFIDEKFIAYFQRNDLTCALQITLDGFQERHDQVRFGKNGRGSYSKIIENISLLVHNGFFVRVRVNYTDENLVDIERVADDFEGLPEKLADRFLIFDFHRVWQNDKKDDLGSLLLEKISKFRDRGFAVSSKYAPDNVRSPCYADKHNSAAINYNGDIFKCTARDFKADERAGFINADGVLVWNDGYIEHRMNAKFKNPPCLRCRILPLCNGGCSQHAIENLERREYCVYSGDEREKDKIVIFHVEQLVTRARLARSV